METKVTEPAEAIDPAKLAHLPNLTIDEFCKLENVSRTFVYSEIRSGRLRARKYGRSTRVLREDREEWLKRLPAFEASAA